MGDLYFNEAQNDAELVSHMIDDEQRRWNAFGHKKIEAAFIDRVWIVYKPMGLTGPGRHKPPQVLTTIKVTDFEATAAYGVSVTLVDAETDQELKIRHVPCKLFHYPIYVCVPARLQLRWDARSVRGQVKRSLSFALVFKTKNDSGFYSQGNVYLESPKKFKELYKDVTGTFVF